MSRVLLACSGSVAIYKACDLASRLRQEGHQVRAVLTPRAAQLVHPQLFEAVTGEPAFSDEFGTARHGSMDHIDLSKWGQCLIVAPASADLIARLALGMADDLVATTALALPAATPRLVVPAMNPNMLAQSAVQRNMARLREDGWQLLPPESGHMACGDEGSGRLADVQHVVAWVKQLALR